MICVLVATPDLLARPGEDFVGKRVVRKTERFELRIDKTDQARLPPVQAPRIRRVADYDEAIRLDPNCAAAYDNGGFAWSRKNDNRKAVADFTETIRLNPRNAVAFYNRGTTWMRLGNYEKAIADFDEAIGLDPTDASAFCNRAWAWSQKDEHTKAIDDYANALRLKPGLLFAYRRAAARWYWKEEFDKAMTDFGEAIRLDRRNARLYSSRGLAFQSMREFAKALIEFNEAVRIDPKNAHAYNSRAWLLATCSDEKVRDGKRAVESATKACELTEWKNGFHVGTLAAAYAEVGDFDAAIKWQARANALYNHVEDRKKGEARLKLYEGKTPYREIDL
jgi:tetratricopeptide (TPR) repeat protein